MERDRRASGHLCQGRPILLPLRATRSSLGAGIAQCALCSHLLPSRWQAARSRVFTERTRASREKCRKFACLRKGSCIPPHFACRRGIGRCAPVGIRQHACHTWQTGHCIQIPLTIQKVFAIRNTCACGPHLPFPSPDPFWRCPAVPLHPRVRRGCIQKFTNRDSFNHTRNCKSARPNPRETHRARTTQLPGQQPTQPRCQSPCWCISHGEHSRNLRICTDKHVRKHRAEPARLRSRIWKHNHLHTLALGKRLQYGCPSDALLHRLPQRPTNDHLPPTSSIQRRCPAATNIGPRPRACLSLHKLLNHIHIRTHTVFNRRTRRTALHNLLS
eukprot:30524_6